MMHVFECVWTYRALLQICTGSFAEVWCSFAEVWYSFADTCVSTHDHMNANIQGTFADG